MSIDRESTVSLQEQLRRQIIDAIAIGTLPSGMRLPSSRQLSADLEISRNTVAAVYDRLIADGHLSSSDRSGVYVRDDRTGLERDRNRVTGPNPRESDMRWRNRLSLDAESLFPAALPPDWEKYPFPFFEGPFDRSLFPVQEWRDASRRALTVSEIEDWTGDVGDADDPMLIDELRRKILPQRGITARPEEILVTTSAQQALYFATELFVNSRTVVGLENPCNPELRTVLTRKRARLEHNDVDEDGMILNFDRLGKCGLLFISPGRQRPTGVTMSDERRKALLDFATQNEIILVEDDYQWEADFATSNSVALRGAPGGQNVIYAATLAQPLAPAVRLGVLVAPAPVIRAARKLRRITSRHPALSIQRTFAHMLGLGHYAAALRRVEQAFADRMAALREALNYYLPTKISILPTQLGAAAWITGPPELDANRLGKAAEAYGALIEPVDAYYAERAPQNVFRLGVTGIPEDRIREGVSVVAKAFRESLDLPSLESKFDESRALSGAALKRACSGATLLCKTVYGDPCTIVLARNGDMNGRAGFANEEQDTGKWWIDDDYWCRQWTEWAYGETAKFRVMITGDRIQWFNPSGRLIDWAVIVRANGKKATKPENQELAP
ncbi:MAG: PLP-dependent aminotransferase family protein [Alphaproteobacteria bacterium]|nr:PLP-dependent aminotransferase family protein [Alphaproteobacteria bacterium]